MRIGENIKAIRQSKNMTQEELAEKIYTTRQTVSNYEKGRSDPDLETIKRTVFMSLTPTEEAE